MFCKTCYRQVARESRKRSYTPPVVGKSTYTPPASPRRRTAATPVANLPLPTYTSPALSTSVKDKIAATLGICLFGRTIKR